MVKFFLLRKALSLLQVAATAVVSEWMITRTGSLVIKVNRVLGELSNDAHEEQSSPIKMAIWQAIGFIISR